MPEPPPQGPGNTEARLLWLEKQAELKGEVDIDQLPWKKLLNKLEATWHPDADALFDGAIAFGGDVQGPYVGPWGTVLPTPASPGTATFNIPVAGTYLLIAVVSAFTLSAGTFLDVTPYLDGVSLNTMTVFASAASDHRTLVPSFTRATLTQGQHIINFYHGGTTTSNNGNRGFFAAVRIG